MIENARYDAIRWASAYMALKRQIAADQISALNQSADEIHARLLRNDYEYQQADACCHPQTPHK